MTGDAFIPVEVEDRWGIAAVTGRSARVVAYVVGDRQNAEAIAELMSAAVAGRNASEPFA